MDKKEQVVRSFIDAYNRKDVAGCANLLSEDVELLSTYVMRLFPESGGKLSGRQQFADYLEWFFNQMEDVEANEYELENKGDFYVVRADSNNQKLNYYLHYYVNEDNLLYLIKSNLTQPSENSE